MRIGILGTGVVGKTLATRLTKLGHEWKEVIDLGDITAAHAQEMYLALWVRLFGKLKTPNVNIHVVF